MKLPDGSERASSLDNDDTLPNVRQCEVIGCPCGDLRRAGDRLLGASRYLSALADFSEPGAGFDQTQIAKVLEFVPR